MQLEVSTVLRIFTDDYYFLLNGNESTDSKLISNHLEIPFLSIFTVNF